MIKGERRKIVFYTSGQGEPILLSASAGRSVSDFNSLVTALNDHGFMTIAVQAPMIETSDRVEGLDLYDLADDLHAALSKISQKARAVSIGHAFGNRVARAFSTKYADQTKGVVLIGAGSHVALTGPVQEALKNCFNDKISEKEHLENIKYAFFADQNSIPSDWKTGWHIETAIMQGRATPNTPSEKWKLAGEAPILVLQGSADKIAPPDIAGKVLLSLLPARVTYKEVTDTGHALVSEKPSFVRNEIISFCHKLK